MFCKKLITLVLLFSPLVACTPQESYENEYVTEARVTDRTRAGDILEKLPQASEKTSVSLYDFQDLTGQFKYNDKYSDFSSAVTKGGLSILTKALLDAGNKKWFTVTERGGLKDLLQERQLIKVMRSEYRTPDGQQLPELPPLVYGGMLLQGGIIGYDSNVVTGGAGALYLGIGGNTRYARDVVTVYLRAVSVQTGEVLLSVTSSKTIFSTSLDSNVLKYITFDRLLQAEAGFSLNEPVQLATRQATETAVYSLIMEGVNEGLWEFKDPIAGKRAMAEYLARRDGPPQDVANENDPDTFEKAMLDSGNHANNAAPAMPAQNPIETSAVMQPVVSQPLAAPVPAPVVAEAPAPVMQPAPQVAAVAQPEPQAAVIAQPAPVAPVPVAAVEPLVQPAPQQAVIVQPAAQQPVVVQQPAPKQAAIVPGVRNRGFEPQVQPENGPLSSNIPPVQQGPGTSTGWGYDGTAAAGNAAPASAVVPASYQPAATTSGRQRPKENSQPVYY